MFSSKLLFSAFILFLWNQVNGEDCETGSIKLREDQTKDQNCNLCGITHHNTELVINGVGVTPENKYPWVVPIFSDILGKWSISCGGSIISAKFILTAAHCLYDSANDVCKKPGAHRECDMKPVNFQIGLSRNTLSEQRKRLEVLRVIVHPEFDFGGGMHDIALIELKERLICNEFERPVCLPRKPMNKLGAPVIVAGWGRYAHNKIPEGKEEILREGQVIQVDSRLCDRHGSDNKTTGQIFCALGIWNRTSCYGDSGSSVFGDFQGIFYALGVTSHGQKHCQVDYAVTFSNTHGYLDFIESHVKDLPSPPS